MEYWGSRCASPAASPGFACSDKNGAERGNFLVRTGEICGPLPKEKRGKEKKRGRGVGEEGGENKD